MQAPLPGKSARPGWVVVKALLILVVVSAAYFHAATLSGGSPGLAWLLPAQARFPIYVRSHSEQTPSRFGIQNVFDLETLFASHVISRSLKPSTEYRVLLLGDSTVRDSGLAEDISEAGLQKCGAKAVKAYSLGYYGPSVLKDLIILQQAMRYKPDLLVWFFEQEALLGEPKAFARSNPGQLTELAKTYGLPGPGRARQAEKNAPWYQDTLLGQRDRLNLAARLTLDDEVLRRGLGSNDAEVTQRAIEEVSAAAATSSDPAWQKIADSYGELRPTLPRRPREGDYLFQAFAAGEDVAGQVPVILLNEPVNRGKPGGWQYEAGQYSLYSQLVERVADGRGWTLLNLSDTVPTSDFRDRIHHGPAGDKLVEQQLLPEILAAPCIAAP